MAAADSAGPGGVTPHSRAFRVAEGIASRDLRLTCCVQVLPDAGTMEGERDCFNLNNNIIFVVRLKKITNLIYIYVFMNSKNESCSGK